MKKLLFIGAIALAACLAFSNCGGKVTNDDIEKVNKLMEDGKCEDAAKEIEAWADKDFDENFDIRKIKEGKCGNDEKVAAACKKVGEAWAKKVEEAAKGAEKKAE